MVIEGAFILVLTAALTGLGLSALIERCMTHCPPIVRPWAAWSLHSGIWLLMHGLLTLLLGRPWFAASTVSALFLMLVFVNNAKVKALREPFVFQDYEYFTDMIRHPRLYIPFFGWWKFLGTVTGFALAFSVGFWGESPPPHRFSSLGQLSGIAVVVGTAILLLLTGNHKYLPVTFDPKSDMLLFGLLPCFWRYGQEDQNFPEIASPFDIVIPNAFVGNLPHLVAVQSESFFDPRTMFPGIRPEILTEFDRLKFDAIAHGKLSVPAWGANTVRTEFAFLSGIDASKLGVHRFNPYRTIAAGWDVSSLASFLKYYGYRTICIHPYPASFYRRDRVYPRHGFDEFLDVRNFDTTQRFGPYISDLAIVDKVSTVLHEATSPVFIFVITMENHGPLHLERIEPSDDDLYFFSPPIDCDDLTIYLRHLRNADRMIAGLRSTLERGNQAASLCWFSDHVPIMPTVYATFGVPNGEVEYCIWNTSKTRPQKIQDISAQELAITWLSLADLPVS